MAIGSGRDSGTAGTLRGVVFILAVGLALGTLYNSIGRASRPPRGLAWVKHAEAAVSLETLQGTANAATRPQPAAPAGTPVALAAAPARDSAAADSSRRAKPAAAHARRAHAPAPPSATTPTPGAPAAPTTVAATPAPASDLPVIPDLAKPIQLELATLRKLYDAGAVLVVDAREAAEYADGHIAGALSLPYNDAMAEPERMRRLGEAGRPIAVYCSGGACEVSMDLAKLMLENGRHRVLVYMGGFPEWKAAGLPVATGTVPGSRR